MLLKFHVVIEPYFVFLPGGNAISVIYLFIYFDYYVIVIDVIVTKPMFLRPIYLFYHYVSWCYRTM